MSKKKTMKTETSKTITITKTTEEPREEKHVLFRAEAVKDDKKRTLISYVESDINKWIKEMKDQGYTPRRKYERIETVTMFTPFRCL